jgi:hypothetical protein
MKSKVKTYQWYSDPGHAWLKVPFADLYDTTAWNKISSYSFLGTGCRFGYVFLEEDNDAGLFLEQIADAKTKELRHSNTRESFIRQLPRYTKDKFVYGLAVQKKRLTFTEVV